MINNARMTIGQIPILIILNMVLLHSSTLQCYNVINKDVVHVCTKSPNYASS